jgi:ketosteroid isomerase-like protein
VHKDGAPLDAGAWAPRLVSAGQRCPSGQRGMCQKYQPKGNAMNTMEIANKMVALCREGKNHEALETLFADDMVSVEAVAMPGAQQEAKGLAAVKAKGQWWVDNHEVHSAQVTGPWPHGDRFVVGFQYDVTNKPSGKRMKLDEVGLYTVRDGKIAREEFFYDTGM